MTIRDIRKKQGLTQQQFSEKYSIPLPTLRHWEQNVTTPPGYFLALFERTLSGSEEESFFVQGKNNERYIYFPESKVVTDTEGNRLEVSEDLRKVKKENLRLYLTEMFEELYKSKSRFERLCKRDQESDIIWIER